MNAAKLFNLQRPIAHHLIPKYIKSILLGDLIVQSGKSLFTFIFYVWDWATLGVLFLTIIVSVLIIMDSPLLSSMIKTFPLIASMSMDVGTKFLGVEQSETWFSWFTNTSTNIWSGICWFNSYLFTGCEYIYTYTIYYPYKLLVLSWIHFKTLLAVGFVINTSIFISKCYMYWNDILQTSIELCALFPGLPNFIYTGLASFNHVLLEPIYNVITNQGSFYDLLSTERSVLQHIVNMGSLSVNIVENYCLTSLYDLTNCNNSYLTFGLRVLISPFYLYFKVSSWSLNG
jgi:hypothetical protein